MISRDHPEVILQMSSNSAGKIRSFPYASQLLPNTQGFMTASAPVTLPFTAPSMVVGMPGLFPVNNGTVFTPQQQQQAMWQQQMQLMQFQMLQMQQQQQAMQVAIFQQQQPQLVMAAQGGLPATMIQQQSVPPVVMPMMVPGMMVTAGATAGGVDLPPAIPGPKPPVPGDGAATLPSAPTDDAAPSTSPYDGVEL
jgi:hypothetical protein